jgi:hypothetical protein
VLADFLSSGVHLDCPFVEALCGRDAMLADFWAAYAAAQMETLGNVRKWRNMVWDRDRWTAWRHELATKVGGF